MRKFVVIISICIFNAINSFSQVAVNPQIGFNFASLQNLDNVSKSEIKAGFQAGVDVRIGEDFYFQPGLFFSKVKTTFGNENDNTLADSSRYSVDFVRSSVKLKALLGVNLFSVPTTKIRLNAGPTFDVVIDKTVEGANLGEQALEQAKDEFKSSAFNLDFGAGVDLLKFTAELGYSFSFSKAVKDHDASFGVYYLNIGIVF